mmetsp:Transcript_2409/g.1730  ORF Transcript_2409/g.1730 Transcript_2409/m.1730 type:complete len:110 (-) Transcript_2409:117-446(-)
MFATTSGLILGKVNRQNHFKESFEMYLKKTWLVSFCEVQKDIIFALRYEAFTEYGFLVSRKLKQTTHKFSHPLGKGFQGIEVLSMPLFKRFLLLRDRYNLTVIDTFGKK